MTPQQKHHEKRREERREASGVVRVNFADPQPRHIEGRLKDISVSGFRMAHGFTSLVTGQEVDFSHAEAQGKARVIWNRIVADRVETGFLVITGN
jgi:hypothetical protein